MDKEAVLEQLEWLISHYEDLPEQVFYVREEYLDRGQKREEVAYEIDVRAEAPPPEEADVLGMPLDPVRVGVKMAAFNSLGRSHRYLRLSGRVVVARLERLADLVDHGRLQPPGLHYGGLEHPTFKVPAFLQVVVRHPDLPELIE